MPGTSPRPAASRPAPSLRWPLLALLIAMTAIGPLAFNMLVPAVPGLAVRLGAEPASVQLTISLFLFGMALSQLVLGPLSDRFGRRPVAIAGLALTALASLAALAADSVGALVTARLVQALGASTGVVIGRAIVRDLLERDRAAAAIGVITTAMVVAPMIAPMIGGLLDTAYGFEAIFGFIALASLLVLLWTLMALPESRPATAPQDAGHFFADLKTLLRSKPFHAYSLAGTFGSASFFAFVGASPHVVVGIMHHSSAEYGFWFAVSAFGYMAGNFVTSRLSVRQGVDRMILLGCLCEIIGGALCIGSGELFLAAGPVAIFVPQALVGFGNGLLLPNAIAGAVSIEPRAAGTASGISGFLQMATGAAAAQFTGWLVAGATRAWPMTSMVFAFAVATLIAFVLLNRRD